MSDETNLTDKEAANVPSEQVEANRALIQNAEGLVGKLLAYTRLSGPGWLQSAITLGGGSLAGSLYLGVLAGFGAMFWQPLAMIMGIIMLSAIGKTLNIMTLGGLALAVGILVDDATVTIENINYHWSRASRSNSRSLTAPTRS